MAGPGGLGILTDAELMEHLLAAAPKVSELGERGVAAAAKTAEGVEDVAKDGKNSISAVSKTLRAGKTAGKIGAAGVTGAIISKGIGALSGALSKALKSGSASNPGSVSPSGEALSPAPAPDAGSGTPPRSPADIGDVSSNRGSDVESENISGSPNRGQLGVIIRILRQILAVDRASLKTNARGFSELGADMDNAAQRAQNQSAFNQISAEGRNGINLHGALGTLGRSGVGMTAKGLLGAGALGAGIAALAAIAGTNSDDSGSSGDGKAGSKSKLPTHAEIKAKQANTLKDKITAAKARYGKDHYVSKILIDLIHQNQGKVQKIQQDNKDNPNQMAAGIFDLFKPFYDTLDADGQHQFAVMLSSISNLPLDTVRSIISTEDSALVQGTRSLEIGLGQGVAHAAGATVQGVIKGGGWLTSKLVGATGDVLGALGHPDAANSAYQQAAAIKKNSAQKADDLSSTWEDNAKSMGSGVMAMRAISDNPGLNKAGDITGGALVGAATTGPAGMYGLAFGAGAGGLGNAWDNNQQNDPLALGKGDGEGKSLTARQRTALEYFKSQGWTAEQASGIVANLTAESQLKPGQQQIGCKGPNCGYGIGQWDKSRRDKFKTQMGKDIHGSSLSDQLKFVQWELEHTQRSAYNALKATQTADEAGRAVSITYERPKDKWGQARKRGERAQLLLAQLAPPYIKPTNTSSSAEIASSSARQKTQAVIGSDGASRAMTSVNHSQSTRNAVNVQVADNSATAPVGIVRHTQPGIA